MTDADRTPFSAYDPAALPAPVLTYLDAHDEKRYDDAAAAFAPDATVLDDGRTYEGRDAIRAWLENSSTEYTYTTSRTGQSQGQTNPVVQIRLDGNFPGGTVTLRYQFRLDGELITHLAIEV